MRVLYRSTPNGSPSKETTLPDLSTAVRLCVDIETYDPNLKTTGPSVRTGGWVAGIGIGAEFDDGKIEGWYIPVEHEGYEELCLDKDEVMEWLQVQVSRKDREVLFANAIYDLDFLYNQHNIWVEGPIIDVQVAEPLIDENKHVYSLGSLADKYLGETKVDNFLYEYCSNTFGGKAVRSQAGNIYRCPPEIVAEYGIGDVTLPLRVWEKQRDQLTKDELWEVFTLETELIPLLLLMKSRGVRVDVGAKERLQDDCASQIIQLQEDLDKMAGVPVAVYEATLLEEIYIKLGLSYPRTEAGSPSFTSQVLQNSEFGSLVDQLRKVTKINNTFLDGYINNFLVRDRIHPAFNQLKGEDYGTVTGRFSSSQPNLQNIPNDPRVRSLYIPDEGEDWYKLDYSSVEYRLALHYARGPAAEEMRSRYAVDINFDAHQMTADEIGITRKQAKAINFGLIYGMGVKKLAVELGVTVSEAKSILYRFHDKVPFMNALLQAAKKAADNRGYVHTLAGRRRRFNLWEPMRWQKGKFPLPREQAEHEYGNAIKRGYTYRALNAAIQGSAADAMKKSMVDIFKSGVCDVIGVPMLTEHDELDFSVGREARHLEAIREVKYLMENAYDVKVPLLVDAEKGKSWGQIEEVSL